MASLGPRTRSLRFGCARARRPRPRGIAEISQTAPQCAREVSATADSMAVEPVRSELVSSADSLIYRESTGISSESRLPGEASVCETARSRGPRRRIPCDPEQGNSCDAAGIRGDGSSIQREAQRALHTGPSPTIMPVGGTLELLVFWVDRALGNPPLAQYERVA